MFDITTVDAARLFAALLGLWTASFAGAAYARATGRAGAAGDYSQFSRYLFLTALLLGTFLLSIP